MVLDVLDHFKFGIRIAEIYKTCIVFRHRKSKRIACYASP